MWTHEMPSGPVRQERERLYREKSAEILPALQILAQSNEKVNECRHHLTGECWPHRSDRSPSERMGHAEDR